MLKLENIGKKYELGESQSVALNSVSIAVEPKDFLILTGRSGSGKTTLLNIMGGLELPDSGHLFFEGKRMDSMTDKEISWMRRKYFGFIFQTYNLIPVMTVYENVEYPLTMLGVDAKTKAQKVNEIIDRVGLTKHRDQKPTKLSGGQRQRVAIARSLVKEPKIILADEPTANLDVRTTEEILQLIKDLHQERQSTVVLCTHSSSQELLGNKILRLSDGQVVEYGVRK
jgi:putative ABC transport system ATP-binding protein